MSYYVQKRQKKEVRLAPLKSPLQMSVGAIAFKIVPNLSRIIVVAPKSEKR